MLDSTKSLEAHRLLVCGYADGGGSVEPYVTWWKALTEDSEFDPTLCFVALDHQDELIGLAQCWSSAFLKDLVVQPRWRRRGVGQALLLHVFEAFRSRGASSVSLKVEIDNPTGAERLYRRVGMSESYPA